MIFYVRSLVAWCGRYPFLLVRSRRNNRAIYCTAEVVYDNNNDGDHDDDMASRLALGRLTGTVASLELVARNWDITCSSVWR